MGSDGVEPAHVYFEETGTDTLVTQVLVRRRFGIAGIITINLLLPHLHEGARSQVINGFPNVLDFGKCVAPDRSLAPLFTLLAFDPKRTLVKKAIAGPA